MTRARATRDYRLNTSQYLQVLANLKIAEDRIPSLYAVFHETGRFKTHWVHDAVFYFEAESTLKALVLQRRRCVGNGHERLPPGWLSS